MLLNTLLMYSEDGQASSMQIWQRLWRCQMEQAGPGLGFPVFTIFTPGFYSRVTEDTLMKLPFHLTATVMSAFSV